MKPIYNKLLIDILSDYARRLSNDVCNDYVIPSYFTKQDVIEFYRNHLAEELEEYGGVSDDRLTDSKYCFGGNTMLIYGLIDALDKEIRTGI